MKGGERFGAGRPAWHEKTSSAYRIDIRHLHRNGHLEGYRRLSWAWADRTNINMDVSPGRVIFNYRYREHGDDWKPVDQPVTITTTACHFGGSRRWFMCPRCFQRVAILFIYGWPACRKCKRLVYPSQSEDAMGRNWRKTQKLENRLSGGTGTWRYSKPKWMRQATFDRLWASYFDMEEQRDNMLAAFVTRFGNNLK